MPDRDEELEIRKVLEQQGQVIAEAGEAIADAGTEQKPKSGEKQEPLSESGLIKELGVLYEHSNRVQGRAARLLEETTKYNDRLREVVDSYREAGQVLDGDQRDG